MSNRCNGCGQPIKFIKLQSGKFNPVDEHSYLDLREMDSSLIDIDQMKEKIVVHESGKVGKLGELVSGYISHFSTCPNAKSFRRKNP